LQDKMKLIKRFIPSMTKFENNFIILIELLVQGWRIMFTFYDLEGRRIPWNI